MNVVSVVTKDNLGETFDLSKGKVEVKVDGKTLIKNEDGTLSAVSGGPSDFDITAFARSLVEKDEIVIPPGTTKLGAGYFKEYTHDGVVVIPESVETIGDGAFYDCRNATGLVLTNPAIVIGIDAFYGWESATSLTLPEGLQTIGNSAFVRWISATSLTIPNSVTSIDKLAFNSWESATSLTLPEGLQTIGKWAFTGWQALTRVVYLSKTTDYISTVMNAVLVNDGSKIDLYVDQATYDFVVANYSAQFKSINIYQPQN